MAVTIAGILICLGIIAKICYMVGCVVSCCSCLGRCCCRKKQKPKVEKEPKGRGVNRIRPDTLKLMKSPRSNREPSKVQHSDTPRFKSPRSLENVEYSSLNTSRFDSHGSYLSPSAALAKKEAEVRNQAKRQFEARHKYERLRSVSAGDIGYQNCPLEGHQLSASMCLLPSAPPQFLVMTPNTSLEAFSPAPSQAITIREIPQRKVQPLTKESIGYTANRSWLQNEAEKEKVIQESFVQEGIMLAEPTPDSSIASSPTNSSVHHTAVVVHKKPAPLLLPSDVVDINARSSPLTNGHHRTVSTSPAHKIGNHPRKPPLRRVSDGSIFRFDNVLSPRAFALNDNSDTELDSFNPLKPSKEYTGGTPPNSPHIVSQVAEQFI